MTITTNQYRRARHIAEDASELLRAANGSLADAAVVVGLMQLISKQQGRALASAPCGSSSRWSVGRFNICSLLDIDISFAT